jgi:membrane protease subunit HflK
MPSGNVASFEDFLRRSKARFGGDGGGGGFPGRPDRSFFMWGLLALVLVWLVFTVFHSIAPEERGVVTRFGRYYTTLGPGVSLTLPSPIDRVRKIDVENIRVENLPSQPDAMMLTGDQNIIDIDYSVRWNIRDPELFMFELADPEETIRQVAESAMRAGIARVTLKDAMGDRRGDIEGPGPGRGDQARRSARGGQRRLQGSQRRTAGRAALCEPGQFLRAAANLQGRGRGRGVRQGLRAI